jgi:hypothetical protein
MGAMIASWGGVTDPLSRRRVYLTLCCVLALAFSVRLAHLVVRGDMPPGTDGPSYVGIAHSLVDGTGFKDTSGRLDRDFTASHPQSFWSPGYPVFLAAHLLVSERHALRWTRVTQCILDTMTVGLVGLIALRLFGPTAAIVAALMWTFYLPAVFYSLEIGTETLYTTFVAGWVVLAYLLVERPTAKIGAALGVLAAAAYLTNGLFVAMIVALFPFLWLNGQRPVRYVRPLLVASIAASLILVPWGLRNRALYGRFFVGPTKDGFNLLVGNNPWAKGDAGPTAVIPAEYRPQFAGRTELEMRDIARGLAIGWIREHPRDFVRLAWSKLYYHWKPLPSYWTVWYVALGLLGSYGVAVVGAVVTLFLHGRRNWRAMSLLLGAFVAQSAAIAVFLGAARFRFPLEPLIVVLGSITIAQLLSRLRGIRTVFRYALTDAYALE